MTWSTSSRTWRSSTRRAGCWQTSRKGQTRLPESFVCALVSLEDQDGCVREGHEPDWGVCGLWLNPQRERVCGGL